ncbi:MAG: EAL domain-containing protein [Colwellia sp.]|nr:EAL domain-containing protein [Colwellia sp.]
MKLSLQQQIYFFTLSSALLFVVLVISILWSTQVVEVALKREKYAHKVEEHTHILKQFITSEKIYASNYNTDNWFALDSQFSELLKLAPSLTPQQQTIENSIKSQNKNVLRLFNAIHKNKLKNANEIIKKYLKTRLMTQLEAIRTDSIQLSTIVKKDIHNVIKHQIIFILSVLALVIFILVYGAFRLSKVFITSLNEVKRAFQKNHSGDFQKIQLSNQSEEFNSIAIAFNAMNKKLSETTVSLESMKEIVAEETHVLELITSDELLPVILEAIVHGVEKNSSAMLCSILLLDETGKYLLSGSAPSLPDFYNKAIHGIEIGMGVGSCGTAAFTNKRVIVEDIQNHPYWTPYKQLASKAGLGACWSEPIRSTQGKVLGTFAIYHHKVNQPTEANIALIEQTASLASIAIEKTQANFALKASDEQMQLVLAGAELGSWDWNIATGKVERNERWATMLGYTHKEIKHTTNQWADFVHPQDRERAWQSINDVLEGRSKSHSLEYRMLTKDGGYRWVHDQANVMQRHDNGKPLRMSGTHSDITNRKLSEEKLKLAASVFLHSREGISITDDTATIIDINDAFTNITGFSREEAIGQNPSFLHSGRQSPEFYTDMWQVLEKKGYWSGEVWNRRKNGELYAVMKTISAVRDEQGITTHYVSLGSDITPLKEHQAQLEHIANYDLLTNLPNRSLLADRLSQAMLQCSRHEQSLAVVFLDLDGFKQVNDTYGHDMGDELLVALSVRMKEALRESDSLARIGGDEFVAVLAELAKVEDCEPVLERLLLAASEPVTVGDIVLNISASIGVTLYPQDNVDADQLMRHADQAMYVAKGSGKNRYHLFDTVQDDAVKVQRESLAAIRTALDNHQFILHYQPKVNMKKGTVVGVEALIRWQHPERGLLNPIEFLPVIENHAMMIEMGEWVIDCALSQISQWQKMGISLPASTSVNIAAIQLQQPDFTQSLIRQLAAHPDVEPRCLELEVLETSALEDVHHVSTIMNECIALGVNFALDDFGTGYSSLTYLRRLPASLIKIDQTFVRDMLNDVDDLAIVEGVIALAKSFKRDVIAEGVETIEHGTALLQLGCELAQGYGIARPMPASDIPAWITDWKPDVYWQS